MQDSTSSQEVEYDLVVDALKVADVSAENDVGCSLRVGDARDL
jgi:hypothetical protein